jgi:hypothetical protein
VKAGFNRAVEATARANWLEVIAGSMLAEQFTPPANVQATAKRGLGVRARMPKSKQGGLTQAQAAKQGIGSGVQMAMDLSAGKPVSPQTIKRMVSFFARHQKNYDKGGVKARIAWMLWGGDAGKAWSKTINEQLKAK